jgi:hypothetical protein
MAVPMRLAFVLTDFYLPVEIPASVPASLAALADVLRFARKRKLSGDWRDWLANTAVVASSEPRAAVSLARLLWSSPDPPAACWFADPVHCHPTLDRVQLAPDGCLRLDADDMAELLACFSRDFAGSGWRLADAGDGRLLLGLDRNLDHVETVNPQRWLGRDIASALPSGPGVALLRAVSAEIEMWLFGSPLNRQRRARGLQPVTQLWFWDRLFSPAWLAERLVVRTANSRGPDVRLIANDAFARRLAQVHGIAIRRDAPELATLLAGGARETVWLQPVHESAGPSLLQFIALQLEPALRALRARRLSRLTVIANDTEYRLSPGRFLRFWRARRDARAVLLS